MFKNMEIFKIASALAGHAGARQSVISQNIANADTPGYKARDLPEFSVLVRGDALQSRVRATRPGHLLGRSAQMLSAEIRDRNAEASPNENTVTIEQEMLHAVDVKRSHDRALAVYKSSLGILRTALGGGR